MNKLSIIAGLMILAGILIVGGALLLAGGDFSVINTSGETYVDKEYVCRGEIDSISIDESSNGVIFESADVKNVIVKYCESDKVKYDITEKNAQLTVIKDTKFSISWGINLKDTKVTVLVPKTFAGDITVKSSSGSIKIADASANKVDLNHSSGSIELINISIADKLEAVNTSGSIKLENVTAKSVDLSNTSGSVTITNVNAADSANVKTSSGSIKLDRLKAGGNITLKCTSGSVKGSICGKESDFSISAGCTSGSCNLENSSGASRELSAKTTSGSIKIEFVD